MSLRALAREAQLHPSSLAAIEHGLSEPTLATAAAIGAALGADPSFRLYPVTGPRIRDHLQASMVEAVLREVAGSWDSLTEVAVRRPARGFIDLVLVRPILVVATEFHSELRRIEQLVRWSSDKASSLASAEGWPEWSRHGDPIVDRLLVIRSTRHNRDVVRAYTRLLASTYPADSIAARRALAGGAWPGSAIVWMHIDGGRARFLERLPPGLRAASSRARPDDE